MLKNILIKLFNINPEIFVMPVPLPQMHGQLNAEEYLLFQMPYALPGIATFIVGIVVAGLSAFAGLKSDNPTRKYMLYWWSVALVGFGTLGIILSIRSVVLDHKLILELHNYLYPFFLLISPGVPFFTYYWTDKKNKSLKYLGFIALFALLIGSIAPFAGGTHIDNWKVFAFGQYPFASTLTRVSTGITFVGAIIVIGIIIHHIRTTTHNISGTMIYGLILLSVLTAGNAPVLLGYNFFPTAIFNFIPMVIIAYGLFQTDFLDIDDFLYNKNGLFFIIISGLNIIFISIVVLISVHLPPAAFHNLNWFPYSVVPFFSTAIVFFLSVYLAATNSSSRVNQISALYLVTIGFILLNLTIASLKLDMLIQWRLEQLGYMIAVFAPATGLHAAHEVLKIKKGLFLKITYLSSLVSSVLAITPFLLSGFFQYSFANLGISGPAHHLFVLTIYNCLFSPYRDHDNGECSRVKRDSYLPIRKSAFHSSILSGCWICPPSGYAGNRKCREDTKPYFSDYRVSLPDSFIDYI